MQNKPASCYIYPNGNIIVFDQNGEQMVRYQKDGFAALGRVLLAGGSSCKFYWCVYRKWSEEVPKDVLGYLWKRVLTVKGHR